jgi:3',5'-cyclic AMP phosphodiesterase CpdA
VIVAQLSDLHFVAPGQRHFSVDTAGTAGAAVDHLNGLRPRPDAVVVTGDVADAGTAEQYREARRVLDRLVPPYYVVPGNHDRRGPLTAVFGDRLGEDGNGFVQYAVDEHPVRLVGLDTLVEGEAHGRLDEARLAWLSSTLAERRRQPTIVFMHHPPFTTGIDWMDAQGLPERAQLGAVLRRNPQVRLVACGHLHRLIHGMVEGTRVAVAPSATESVGLSLGGEEPTFGVEPFACLVHTLLDGQLVTHTTFVTTPP